MSHRGRISRSGITAKQKRERAQKAREQKQRLVVAVGLNLLAIAVVGATLAARSRSLEQAGHFRVPVSLLAFEALLLVAGACSAVAWLRNR